MLGVAPRPSTLTPRQLETSAEIAAVTELPVTVADLISELAVPDFSQATQAPELTLTGALVHSDTNRQITDLIELALTSSSSECDPKIKAQVFETGSEPGQNGRTVSPYLIAIINNLKDKGLQLNLDDVKLSNLNLNASWLIELGGMSARGATFSNMDMGDVVLENVDLTGARFINTNLTHAKLNHANIINATFSNVTFRTTEAGGLTGNQSAIIKRLLSCPGRINVNGEVCSADKTVLEGVVTGGAPDRERFVLPVHQNIVPCVSNYGD